MENFLSAAGVSLRLDDNQDGYISPTEQQAMTDAITEASETVNYYCFDKYDPSILATSNLINRWAMMLAAYRICSRRGNPVPDLIVEDAAKVEERLKEVRDRSHLPNVPLRRKLAPVWSFTRVVVWPYQFRCIRVERQNSSQHNKTALPTNTDFEEAYIPEQR